ncbi:MAG: hypothetical protein WCH39_29935, partial [Schlesneria sp.]
DNGAQCSVTFEDSMCHCLTVFGQAVLFSRQTAADTASPRTPKRSRTMRTSNVDIAIVPRQITDSLRLPGS